MSLAEAQNRHREGRIAEAERLYRAVLGDAPNHVEALHSYGILAAQTGRMPLAADLIGRAVSLGEDRPELHNSFANALAALGRTDDAARHYARAVALSPAYAEAHFNLANLLAATGRPAAAIPHYRRTIELRPQDVDAMVNLGSALAESGEHRAAILEFERALARRPGVADLHINIGHAASELGLLERAVSEYRRALALDPRAARAHGGLAKALQQQGAHEQALASFREAVALAPANPVLHVEFGLACADADRRPEAAAEAEAALRLDDGARSFPHFLLGVLLARCGRREEAALRFRRSLADDPADARGAALCLAALGLARVPDRAPDGLLAGLYEHRAGWFDRSGQAERPYPAAKWVAETFRRWAEDRDGLEVLDIGCGAGLVASLIAAGPWSIDGVDRSPALLSRARSLSLYRALYEADLVAFLANRPAAYHAVLAAAVLVHFGDLDPVLAAAARAVRTDGIMVFTLFHNERDEDGAAVGGLAQDLAQTGGFVHGRALVRRLAEAHGFAVEALHRDVHDFHFGRARPGLMVALRRATENVGP